MQHFKIQKSNLSQSRQSESNPTQKRIGCSNCMELEWNWNSSRSFNVAPAINVAPPKTKKDVAILRRTCHYVSKQTVIVHQSVQNLKEKYHTITEQK